MTRPGPAPTQPLIASGDAATRQSTAALLWAAAAPFPDLEAVRSALRQPVDLGLLAHAAEIGRVGPLVLRNLAAVGRPANQAPWAQRLVSEAGLRRSQEAVLLPRVLRAGLTPLVDAGIEPLVLKGPTLLGRYPARGLRGMDDLDVLVPAATRHRAAEVLRAAGWMPARHTRAKGYDAPFVHADLPGLPMELHHDLDHWLERTSRLRGHDLWAARQPTELCGVAAWELPPEQMLLHLSIHAAKTWHIFSRLVWVADLAVVIRAGVDWDRVDRLRAEWRCTVPLAVGLSLAARMGAVAPANLMRLPRTLLASGALDDVLDPAWSLDPDASRRLRVAAALMDRRRDQARMTVGWVAQPWQHGRRLRATGIAARGAARWTWRRVSAAAQQSTDRAEPS